MSKYAMQKKRGIETRRRKKIILIAAEGNNKTETCYFKHFNRLNKNYIIRFSSGNNTDPLGIAHSAYKSANREGLNYADGDLSFCLIDTDTDSAKQVIIDKTLEFSKKKHIEIILSNPCFEIWFLQHFGYSTKSFSSSEAVIKELRKHISDYQKCSDVFEILLPMIKTAEKNSIRLEEYHKSCDHKYHSLECNPSTDVYRAIKIIHQD